MFPCFKQLREALDAGRRLRVRPRCEVFEDRCLLTGFGPWQEWTDQPYFGTRGTFVADVDGDGRADAVAVSDDRPVFVRLATGTEFGSPQQWTEQPLAP